MDSLAELDQALRQLVQQLDGAALQAITEPAARLILAEAEQRVSRRTGETLTNLEVVSRHTATSATSTVQVANSGPGGTDRQAIFLEYGTVHMPAQPFMRPAFEAAKTTALQALENGLQDQLSKFQ